MTKVEIADQDCTECGTELLLYNPAQVFGCEECEKAWSMEQLDDWGSASQMPPSKFKYSEYFNK
jgi:uncharacterized Zn ribbon protein